MQPLPARRSLRGNLARLNQKDLPRVVVLTVGAIAELRLAFSYVAGCHADAWLPVPNSLGIATYVLVERPGQSRCAVFAGGWRSRGESFANVTRRRIAYVKPGSRGGYPLRCNLLHVESWHAYRADGFGFRCSEEV